VYTQCPECGAAFRVTANVLRQAAGKVRCGSCRSAFNALDYLSEDKPATVVRTDSEPQLPELTPEPTDELESRAAPKTISAAQSAALLKALDQLAGDDVRIEDTGVEWRVLEIDPEDTESAQDDEAFVDSTATAAGSLSFILQDSPQNDQDEISEPTDSSPVDESFVEDEDNQKTDVVAPGENMRFDDNTRLPAGFGVDGDETADVKPEIEITEPPQDPDAPQVDLALGEPAEWQELLGEVDAEEDPGRVVAKTAANSAAEEDDIAESGIERIRSHSHEPLDTDAQFAIQAKRMGLDLGSLRTLIDEGHTGELPLPDALPALAEDDDTEEVWIADNDLDDTESVMIVNEDNESGTDADLEDTAALLIGDEDEPEYESVDEDHPEVDSADDGEEDSDDENRDDRNETAEGDQDESTDDSDVDEGSDGDEDESTDDGEDDEDQPDGEPADDGEEDSDDALNDEDEDESVEDDEGDQDESTEDDDEDSDDDLDDEDDDEREDDRNETADGDQDDSTDEDDDVSDDELDDEDEDESVEDDEDDQDETAEDDRDDSTDEDEDELDDEDEDEPTEDDEDDQDETARDDQDDSTDDDDEDSDDDLDDEDEDESAEEDKDDRDEAARDDQDDSTDDDDEDSEENLNDEDEDESAEEDKDDRDEAARDDQDDSTDDDEKDSDDDLDDEDEDEREDDRNETADGDQDDSTDEDESAEEDDDELDDEDEDESVEDDEDDQDETAEDDRDDSTDEDESAEEDEDEAAEDDLDDDDEDEDSEDDLNEEEEDESPEEDDEDSDEDEDEPTEDDEDAGDDSELTEDERSINMMIDQDLLAIAVQDEDGMSSTIMQKQLENPEDAAAEPGHGNERHRNGPLVEAIVMEGDFVRSEFDRDQLDSDTAAGAQSLIDQGFDPEAIKSWRSSDEHGEVEKRSVHKGFLLGSIVLLLLLGAQAVHQSRDKLATLPIFETTVGPIYRALGYPVIPGWDVSGWRFEATKGSTDNSEQRLTIYSRIGNTSEQPLAYPLVHLSLTDRFEEIVGSRVVEHSEYLVADADPRSLVQPGATFDALIAVESPSADATGFKLNVCYRLANAELRCAVEDFK
jgi:predicted Zn finger-like uncharacterized protein